MSKYQSTRDMLAVVAKSSLPFDWTECTKCIFGIARAEGFFIDKIDNGYPTYLDMGKCLGLSTLHRSEIFIGFSNIFGSWGDLKPTEITKEMALEYCYAAVARWEADDLIKDAQNAAQSSVPAGAGCDYVVVDEVSEEVLSR